VKYGTLSLDLIVVGQALVYYVGHSLVLCLVTCWFFVFNGTVLLSPVFAVARHCSKIT